MTATASVPITSIVDPRRRAVLRALADETDPVSLDRLATELAARAADKPVEEVTDEERTRWATSLHHVHLPALDDAGYCRYDAAANVVRQGETAVGDGGLAGLHQSEGVDDDRTTAVLRAVSTRRRRSTLAVLADAERPLSVDALATAVAIRRADGRPADVDDATRRRVRTSLYHVGLPALADADLVEYDRERATVAGTETPFPDPSQLDVRPIAQLAAVLSPATVRALERPSPDVTA